jgi:hypothetical protein
MSHILEIKSVNKVILRKRSWQLRSSSCGKCSTQAGCDEVQLALELMVLCIAFDLTK